MTIQDKMHQGALYQPMNADLQKEPLKLALKVILRRRFIQTLVGRMFILAVVSMLILI